MPKKRLPIIIAGSLLVALTSPSCSSTRMIKMSYYDETTYEKEGEGSLYNENLFYRNEREIDIADPSVLYVSDPEDPDYGSYFLYGTNSNFGFFAYKSTDLFHWDALGYALLYQDAESLEGRALQQDCWAPEVVYDGEAGKYYMFFSATPRGSEYANMGYVAEATSPRGPFQLVDSLDRYSTVEGTALKDIVDLDSDNDLFFQRFLAFDPSKLSAKAAELGLAEEGSDLLRVLDFHPFVSSKGDKYLYFTVLHNSYIVGMKMNGWLDPDYSSLTVLARPGYASPSSGDKDVAYEPTSNRINEGGYVNEHNGKYYLTFSINSSSDKSYSVVQAIADEPLGPYRKLTEAEGAILLSADSSMRDDVSGTGHHCLVNMDGKDYIIYHAHNSVENGGNSRHLAIDEVKWVDVNSTAGPLEVMYANGPTTSIEPLPEKVSGYANLAEEATFSATNLQSGSDIGALNDGLLSINRFANYEFNQNHVKEAAFTDQTTIEIDLGEPHAVKAIMVYNSKNMESAFYDVKRIEFDVEADDGSTYTKYIDNLKFDWQAYTSADDIDVIRPTGSAIAEFDDIRCQNIRLTIAPATLDQIAVHGLNDMPELAVSEIRVLGK